MKNKKLKNSVLTIVLYVLAGLLLIYGVYMIITAVNYLNSYFQTYGTTMNKNFGDSFGYIMTNSLTYFIYAVLFFVSGKIYNAVRALNPDNYVEKFETKKQTAVAEVNLDKKSDEKVEAKKEVKKETKKAAKKTEKKADEKDDKENK